MNRRILAAGLAAATALSLSVVPAQAQESTSSLLWLNRISLQRIDNAQARNDQAEVDRLWDEWERFGTFVESSVDNDRKKGYPQGTTFDILWGTGLAVAILAAVGGYAYQNGLIQLPQLPF